MNTIFDQLAPALPARYKQMTNEALKQLAAARRRELGSRLFLPGHHYQRDEVIQFADVTGDSLQLARQSAARPEAPHQPRLPGAGVRGGRHVRGSDR